MEHPSALILCGRFVERPPQIIDGGVGGAARGSFAGRRSQHAYPHRIALGRKAQYMSGDALALRSARLHQGSSSRMEPLPLVRRDLAVHRAADHRVDEVEIDVTFGSEHVDRDESLCGDADRARREPSQRSDVAQRCRRSQDRDRARDGSGILGQEPQPPTHSVSHPFRAELDDLKGLSAAPGHASVDQLGDELTKQKRVTAARRMASGRELINRAGEVTSNQHRGRAGRQRRGAHDLCGARQHVDQRLVGARLTRAGRTDEHERQILRTFREVHEPAQRRRIGPMDVVGEQQQGLTLRKVDGQPVQTVQVREQPILAARLHRSGREDRCRGLRAAAEGARRVPHAAFEQLPHDAKAKRPVELRSAAAQDTEAGILAARPGHAQQLRLPDAGLPLDENHAASSALRVLDDALEQVQLGVALQERNHSCGTRPHDAQRLTPGAP